MFYLLFAKKMSRNGILFYSNQQTHIRFFVLTYVKTLLVNPNFPATDQHKMSNSLVLFYSIIVECILKLFNSHSIDRHSKVGEFKGPAN